MQFRLTYDGPLLATQRDPLTGQQDRRAGHKHDIRQIIHAQLRRLWDITPFLRTGERSGPTVILPESSPDMPAYDAASLAVKHSHYGWNFVPLVTEELNLPCELDILFLRPDRPGYLLRSGSGDIDNRLKTLFDALRMPVPGENYHQRTPVLDEQPLFCLLEDDKLITKISVETDQLITKYILETCSSAKF